MEGGGGEGEKLGGKWENEMQHRKSRGSKEIEIEGLSHLRKVSKTPIYL